MHEGSRFDRCSWRGCESSCVDEIRLCWYHFQLAGITFIDKRSIFGTAYLARSRKAEAEREHAEEHPVAPPPGAHRCHAIQAWRTLGVLRPSEEGGWPRPDNRPSGLNRRPGGEPMASARITHSWPDGSVVELAVSIRADGPDAADEMVTRVLVLWRECVGEPEDVEAEEPGS